ncbi:glycosyltransferase family 2 protein [Patescibacteria group bacterium]|nr:glycosyltransferase family 2 protein [Patescibacteria group bacterium]
MTSSENPELSIVILSFNVKELLLNCLDSIFKNKDKLDKWQIIVVDNASTDGSIEEVRKRYKNNLPSSKDKDIKIIENKENLGFAAGNNTAIPYISAPVVLFINPDTVVVNNAIQKSLEVLLTSPDYGAITCKVELPNGKLDYSCHRGFPTPWNSFAYFGGLTKRFPSSRLFAGYTGGFLDTSKAHEIDCISGTFLMVRKIAAEQIGFWDVNYFFNGEDIEFCFRLREKGWKIYYYPSVKIIHFKGSSSGLWRTSGVLVKKSVKLKSASHAASAMRVFYKKHYYKKYPPLFRDFVLGGIKMLEHWRKFKIRSGLKYE